MFNVRLAGGHLYGKRLFTWLSLVMSLMALFVLSFFPLGVLDEIWDLIESVPEGFLTYYCIYQFYLDYIPFLFYIISFVFADFKLFYLCLFLCLSVYIYI